MRGKNHQENTELGASITEFDLGNGDCDSGKMNNEFSLEVCKVWDCN